MSLDKRKVRGLVPCCGQDGYRAQVPQHTDTYHISIHLTKLKTTMILPLIGILKGLLSILLIMASCGDRLELGDPSGRENPDLIGNLQILFSKYMFYNAQKF